MDFTIRPEAEQNTGFLDLSRAPFDVEKHAIYSVIAGSRGYGINTASSDTDVRGVFFPPLRYVTGMSLVSQIENQSKDIVYWNLKRFFELAYKSNAHILEMLYMHPDSINFIKPSMQKVIDNRSMFISKAIGHSFGKYAYSQVCQMDLKRQNNTGRVTLIEEFGYDVKLFCHAVRLFRMGTEALLTGELKVKRPDAAELLEIRAGKYSFEEAVTFKKCEVEFMGKDGVVRTKTKSIITGGFIFEEQCKLENAFMESKLPESLDFYKIESLLMQIQSELM